MYTYKSENVILQTTDHSEYKILVDDECSEQGGVILLKNNMRVTEVLHNNGFERMAHIYELALKAFSAKDTLEISGVGYYSLIETENKMIQFDGRLYKRFEDALYVALLTTEIDVVNEGSGV